VGEQLSGKDATLVIPREHVLGAAETTYVHQASGQDDTCAKLLDDQEEGICSRAEELGEDDGSKYTCPKCELRNQVGSSWVLAEVHTDGASDENGKQKTDSQGNIVVAVDPVAVASPPFFSARADTVPNCFPV
jgi:hypothetical protein